MPAIMLEGGIVLDPDNTYAQQLQRYAHALGLTHLRVVRATVVGQPSTYLVLAGAHPLFKHPALDHVQAYLATLCS